MTKDTKHWYSSWFDTPFYHILDKDIDHQEAHSFMENLTSYLNIPEGGTILDLACGKGRHSVYLNSIGYDVTGLDLSPQSIAFAKQYENDTLHFDVHDMSKPYSEQFDAVFNLFTSFGYFEKEELVPLSLNNGKLVVAVKNIEDQTLASAIQKKVPRENQVELVFAFQEDIRSFWKRT